MTLRISRDGAEMRNDECRMQNEKKASARSSFCIHHSSFCIRRARGFTLMEVMAVLVIMGILAAMIVPQLAPSDDLTTQAAARTLVADLLYAQNLAIATGGTSKVYISFTTATTGSSGGYSIYSAQPFTSPVTNPTNNKPYTVTYSSETANGLSNVQLESLNLDNSANTVLAFDSLGEPYACTTSGTPVALANTGTITLQCGQQEVTLSIEPDTGIVSLP
jgi:prepilin-type N-terminal cleavage/methylation domain-containing protein